MYSYTIGGALLTACCLSGLATASSSDHHADDNPRYSFNDLWSMEKSFWDSFLYPANLAQINATDDSVFAENVQGRVDITRTFDGRELNNEYIFGLFSEPEHLSLVGVPIAYNITQFTANSNIASATTVVTFNATSFGIIIPVTIDTWIEWDAQKKIVQYDATFRWFGFLLDALLKAQAARMNTTDPAAVQAALTQQLASTICQTHEDYCKGADQQYESKDACIDYLTTKTRFGQAFELGRDTLLCREVHEHMVKYRPDIHCAHIGPTGGDYCVDDKSYEQVVLERYFRDSFIAYGYGEEQNIWVA
ncbi:hypothetical protein IFM61606_07185 [Aspergillus udagawae]|uniref:Uncharacterized protein n=1 Tax=Aspergillus udagawae TaxID=91492 RepID=A0ABQ1AX46_9EURO|nr:hypothetical protein IFM51744_08302 [Aspergillus udagawae]GFF89393.1 hypothetical protein IFM53868_05823 [Aspergillus udagawae]GFG15626.1 hypothetical protein IFM5058_07548 [Aspergillus udagawae]GFG27167.1 hypothetical protein IFM61606_07185 [Aspergillus udagawae]